ncbi:MAG: hypothetical protein GY765_30485 [bacterium]|nr:hypothetical protein [bacterium]
MKHLYLLLLIVSIILAGTVGCVSVNKDSDSPGPGPTPEKEEVSETAVKVLFIGNSLTYYNSMPILFSKLAEAAGKEIYTDQATPGGVPLTYHADSNDTSQKIRSQQWDYVNLQAGDITAFPDMYGEAVTTVNRLGDQIHVNNPDSKILFQMVWGFKNGVTIRELNGENVFYSYDEYQRKIHDGTIYVANETGTTVSPVGWAWHAVVEERPQLELFDVDKSHPSLKGSYLAACVFYVVIFNESVTGVPYYNQLSEEEAVYLQGVASATVLDDMEKWNILKKDGAEAQ